MFPIEAVAAVVALGDSGRPYAAANPSAVRQQDLSALLHQRAGQRRNQVHRGAGICLRMLRILHSADISRVLEQCVLEAAARTEEMGGAVPARSVSQPARPSVFAYGLAGTHQIPSKPASCAVRMRDGTRVDPDAFTSTP